MKNRLTPTILLALAASPLPAAEWAFEPGVEGRYRYDDNLRLQEVEQVETNEFALRTWADFSRRTARSEITGALEYTGRRFDEDGLDSDDGRVAIESFYNFSPRQRASLDLDLIKDTTLDTLLDQTGIVFDRIERTSTTLSPGWLYSFDEKTQLNATVNLTDVSFDDTGNTGLGDYRNYSFNLSATRNFTPQTQLILALGGSRFDRDDDSIESDNLQLTLGFAHQYSERINFGGSVGARQTETTIERGALVCPPGTTLFAPPLLPCADNAGNISNFITTNVSNEDSSTGLVGNLNARYDLERGSLSLNANRSVTANAFSGNTITDSLVATLEHRFSARLRGDMRVQWTQSEDSSDASLRLDRTLIRVSPGLSWDLSRDLRLRAGYRYTQQSRENRDDVDSNAVTLSLAYSWPKMAVSR